MHVKQSITKLVANGTIQEYTISELDKLAIALNPFTYRSYIYDSETNLYYLNSRYYDPETGRFVNADDLSVLDITNANVNGINLYTYCLNNPINNIDNSGYFAIGLMIALGLLLIGTVVGGAVAGKTSYDNGSRGWDLAKDIIIGGAIGLATTGALLMLGGVGLGVFGALTGATATFLGATAVQLFAFGALAFNTAAWFVFPIFGIEMQGVEIDQPNQPGTTNSKPTAPYRGLPYLTTGFVSNIYHLLFPQVLRKRRFINGYFKI